MDQIADIVLDQGKTLCVGQLSHVLEMNIQQCKQLLAQFLNDHCSEVDGIYTWIEGYPVGNTKNIVMLVSTEELNSRKNNMEHGESGKELISCDVYALYPKKGAFINALDDKEKMCHTLWSQKKKFQSGVREENGKWNGVRNKEIEKREQVNRVVGVRSTSLFDRKETQHPFFSATSSKGSKKKVRSIPKVSLAGTTSILKVNTATAKASSVVAVSSRKKMRKNQIMDDSSESDEDDPFSKDEEEEDCNPEIPQNVSQTFSSSKNDDRKEMSSKISFSSQPPQQRERQEPQQQTESPLAYSVPSGSSTKKILQTRQYINSEGYMVTEKIWVEEAEQDRKDDDQQQQVNSASTNAMASKKLPTNKKRKIPTPKAKNGKVQQSLTSFFTKK